MDFSMDFWLFSMKLLHVLLMCSHSHCLLTIVLYTVYVVIQGRNFTMIKKEKIVKLIFLKFCNILGIFQRC
jgi:hypothetical protein